MTVRADNRQVLYFEDLSVGDCWVSCARTVTEADVVNFARLTGDFNPLHVDSEYARQTPFGRPIAHGLLGLSFMAGLASTAPAVSTVALLRIIQWKFLQPIFFGDTIRVETKVVDKQPSGRRRGRVLWHQRVINQHGQVVQEGKLETLVMGQFSPPRQPR